MKLKLLYATLAALCVMALSPVAANAYRYSFIPQSDHAHILDIDPAQDSTVQVVRAGVQVSLDQNGDGADNVNFTAKSGDVIKFFQPQTADPDGTTPSYTVTLPDMTLTSAIGSQVVSGTAPDGWAVHVATRPYCEQVSEYRTTTAAAGAFNVTFATPTAAGTRYDAFAVSPSGDLLGTDGDPGTMDNAETTYRAPGDAFCFDVGATSARGGATPHWVNITGLDWNAAPTTRLVLRRGSTVLANAESTGLDLTAAQKPLPGDVIDVYRPENAPTPSFSWTVPAVSGIFDAGNGLVAIDAPAALSIRVKACLPVLCDFQSEYRGAADTPAGRTILNFAQPIDLNRAMSLAGAQLRVIWSSAGGSYSTDLTPGDLTSPVGKISLAKSLKAKKLGKKALKVKFTSSEAGRSVSKLTIPGKTKKSKPVTLATSKSATVVTGRNTLALKFKSSGKKALKKIAKSRKSVKATLTLTLTDTAGNVTTVVKGTKIK